MKLNNKIGGIPQKIVSTAFFIVVFTFLYVFYTMVPYLPFFMAGVIIITPIAVNIFLHLFACKIPFQKPQKKALPEGTKKIKRIFSIVLYVLKLCAYGVVFAYNKIHKILQIVFSLSAFAGFQFWFVWYLFVQKRNTETADNRLSFLYPITFAILFVVAIVVDKWVKHSKATNERTAAFFHNVRVTAYLTKLSLALLAIVTVIQILGFANLRMYLYYALIGVFYYESALMLISLIFSVIRKESTENPKMIIPLPFAGKSNEGLSITSFLENNTGITMRGLWSMKLIKNIIPYSIVAIAALFWLSTGIVQVESYQEAAVYRFGVLQEETLKPGLHFLFPTPIDKVEFYDTQKVNKMAIGYTPRENQDNLWSPDHAKNEYMLLLDEGKELVSINLQIEYKISDLRTYVTQSNSAESILEAHAYDLIMQKIITTDLDSLLAIDRTEFAKEFQNELDSVFGKENASGEHNVGIEVVSVLMESIHPPVDVANSYEAVMYAGIDAETIVLLAEKEKNTTVSLAQQYKNKTVATAEAEHHSKVAAATKSVSEFNASVAANGENKAAYRYYKYLDALSQAYGKANLILVGEGVDASKIYLGNINNAVISGSGATDNTQSNTDAGDEN